MRNNISSYYSCSVSPDILEGNHGDDDDDDDGIMCKVLCGNMKTIALSCPQNKFKTDCQTMNTNSLPRYTETCAKKKLQKEEMSLLALVSTAAFDLGHHYTTKILYVLCTVWTEVSMGKIQY